MILADAGIVNGSAVGQSLPGTHEGYPYSSPAAGPKTGNSPAAGPRLL